MLRIHGCVWVYRGVKYGCCLLIIHLWPIYYLNRHSYRIKLAKFIPYSSINLRYCLTKFNKVYQYLIKDEYLTCTELFYYFLEVGCLLAGWIFAQLSTALPFAQRRQVGVLYCQQWDFSPLWEDFWVSSKPLHQSFPSLYALSVNEQARAAKMGDWADSIWTRRFSWRRDLHNSEQMLEKQLLDLVSSVYLHCDEINRLVLTHDARGCYLVKSCKIMLDGVLLANESIKANVWKLLLLQNQIPLHGQLFLEDCEPSIFQHRKDSLELQRTLIFTFCDEDAEMASH